MKEFQTILYQSPAPHVVRIVLNRPESRNAQDTTMLYEVNDAFDAVAQDDTVKVIIMAANGPHFSAGHDLREESAHAKMGTPDRRHLVRLHVRRRRGADGPGEGDLHRLQRTLAQRAQADHQLAHTHWLKLHGMLIDPSGLPPETRKAFGTRQGAGMRGGRIGATRPWRD